MRQIGAGYQTLLSLRDILDAKTCNYDGDVVSPLFNIRKIFFKAWQIIDKTSSDFELIDRLESEWNEVVIGISSVDFRLYSVSFTELTESKETSFVRDGLH